MVESLKILMLSYWFPPKIAPAPYELARHLATLGHEIYVFSGTFNCALSSEELDGIHVSRFRQHFPSVPGHIAYGLKAARKLIELHRRKKFDVIHAHGADGWFISKLGLKSKLGVPVIVTMHGNARQEFNVLKTESSHSAHSLLEMMHWMGQYHIDGWSLKGADRIIAVSRQVALEVSRDYGIPPMKMEVVYNGVRSELFSPDIYPTTFKNTIGDRENRPVILYVGRLRTVKGVQYLIRAMPRILKEWDVHLVLVGDGEAKNYLKNLVHNLNVDANVTFLGEVAYNELPSYYVACDVFVCPSLYEPFSLVCLEALASAKPVIMTQRVGAKEIVNENVAKIVKERDENAMASAIIEVLNDDGKRKLMGINGRRLAEKYDWINIAKKTSDIYKNAISLKCRFPAVAENHGSGSS